MEQDDVVRRGNWKNKTQFLLSCIGYAVGIGNVWRFPYVAYMNGGGAFLVPYLLMLFFCGIPLFFMESALGQFSSSGCVSVFKICPLFKGAGYAIIVVNLIVSTYFNIINTYPLLFLMYTFKYPLPWSTCSNSWNTKECTMLKVTSVQNHINDSLHLTINRTTAKTSADEFFHLEILKISSGIEEIGSIDMHLILVNIFGCLLMYLCVMKGIKSVGKIIYLTAIFPYLILFALLIRGLTLPGAWDGVYFYIWPEWSQLFNLQVWANAAMQIFFSLGPGWGAIINICSYNDFRSNSKLDSLIVSLVNGTTSILAGFVVFSVIGFMAYETGLPISTVATGGPGLGFITYPAAISLMPLPNLWAVLFFLMLYTLGLDSMFVQIDVIVGGILDDFPHLRKYQIYVTLTTVTLTLAASVIYCTNSGMYWLQLFDWYSVSIPVILICLCEVTAVTWTYGIRNFIRDVEFMIGEKLSWFWVVSWKIVAPVFLTFIFVTAIMFNTRVSYMGNEYPDWAIHVGWGSCSISIACIPIYMGYRLLYLEQGGLTQRISNSLKPLPDWGPVKLQDRSGWTSIRKALYFKGKEINAGGSSCQQFDSLYDGEDNK